MNPYPCRNGAGGGRTRPPGLVPLTPPALEPVTADEVKAWLRVETAEEDALIDRLIAAARRTAEAMTGRAFLTQAWRLTLDRWPASRAFALPLPPLQSVDAVRLIDDAGAETVWAASNYVVDPASQPGRLALREGAGPPVPGRDIAGLVVDFTAGYGPQPTDVPEPLRQAVVRLAAHGFEHRDAPEAGSLPRALHALLAPFRVALL